MSAHAHPTPRITLAASGDDERRTFAVCAAEGRPLWYGPLEPPPDDMVAGRPASAPTTAAARGIWLAGQAKTQAGLGHALLRLIVTDRQLDIRALQRTAVLTGLALEFIVTKENPARGWCSTYGWLEWSTASLAGLVDRRSGFGVRPYVASAPVRQSPRRTGR
ncbi:hypothetical protein ACWESM_31670 [Nocardia sp. NPDC003999]